jgi:signal transduction histidine kinase
VQHWGCRQVGIGDRIAIDVALRALTRSTPIPVSLDVRVRERLPDQVEVSVYYIVAEALTNAAKHSGASAIT